MSDRLPVKETCWIRFFLYSVVISMPMPRSFRKCCVCLLYTSLGCPCGVSASTCPSRCIPPSAGRLGIPSCYALIGKGQRRVSIVNDKHSFKVCVSFHQPGLNGLAQTVLGGLIDDIKRLNCCLLYTSRCV